MDFAGDHRSVGGAESLGSAQTWHFNLNECKLRDRGPVPGASRTFEGSRLVQFRTIQTVPPGAVLTLLDILF